MKFLRKAIVWIVALALSFTSLPDIAVAIKLLACEGFEYTLNANGTVVIWRYTGSTTSLASLTVPSMLDGHRVTAIGEGAFSNCRALASVTLPEGLKDIGSRAFSYCIRLASVALPDGLASIGDFAFSNCGSITSVTIPDSVSEIGINPFLESPVRVALSPDHPYFAVIDGVLFSKTANLLVAYPYANIEKEYAVPYGIRTIGDHAFASCKTLASVILPEGLKSIGDYAFIDCSSLASITLPEGLASIGDHAFSYCKNLTAVTLPEGLTSIGNNAFSHCESLTAVALPDSLAIIGVNPFTQTPARILLSPNHPLFALIDEVLFDKTYKNLISYPYGSQAITYSVPRGILSIGDFAFAVCNYLTAVTMPEGLTSIGNYAFYNCERLASVTLPEGLTNIGKRAFYACFTLASVTIPASVTVIGDNAFSILDLKTLTVERDSFAANWAKENSVPYTYPDALDWLNN